MGVFIRYFKCIGKVDIKNNVYVNRKYGIGFCNIFICVWFFKNYFCGFDSFIVLNIK